MCNFIFKNIEKSLEFIVLIFKTVLDLKLCVFFTELKKTEQF